jgi:hypothetical protein
MPVQSKTQSSNLISFRKLDPHRAPAPDSAAKSMIERVLVMQDRYVTCRCWNALPQNVLPPPD